MKKTKKSNPGTCEESMSGFDLFQEKKEKEKVKFRPDEWGAIIITAFCGAYLLLRWMGVL